MKIARALFLFLNLISTTLAFGRDYEKICEGKEGCRALVVPKNLKKKGTCSGLLFDKYLCTVLYISNHTSAVSLKCMENSGQIILDQVFIAKSVGYNLLGIIEKTNQDDEIIIEKKDYLSISNEVFSMLIVESIGSSKPSTDASILLNINDRQIELTEVACFQ